MRKIFIFIFISAAFFLYSFDYNSYSPIKEKDLAASFDQIILDKEHLYKFVTKIKLVDYPVKISTANIDIAKKAGEEYFKNPDLYGYQMEYALGDKKNLVLFQSQLMEFFPKEVKLGDEVELFFIISYYKTNKNQNIFFVTEFNSDKKTFVTEKYNLTPLEKIYAFLEKEIESHKTGPGMGVYNYSSFTPYVFKELPSENKKDGIYTLNFKYEKVDFYFNLNKKVYDYIKNKNLVGEKLILFAVLRTFNDFGNKASVDILYALKDE